MSERPHKRQPLPLFDAHAAELAKFRSDSAPIFAANRKKAMEHIGSFVDVSTFAEIYRGLNLGIWPSPEVLVARTKNDIPHDQTYEAVTARWSPQEKQEQWKRALGVTYGTPEGDVLTVLYIHSKAPGNAMKDPYEYTAEELGSTISDVRKQEKKALEIIKTAQQEYDTQELLKKGKRTS